MSTAADVSAAGLDAATLLSGYASHATDRLLDLAPVAVYVCDRDGLIVRHNRRAAELWGRSPRLLDPAERYCGSLRQYRLDGRPLAHSACPMVDVLASGEPVRNEEVVMQRPDGSRRLVLVNIEPMRDTTGAVAGAISCFQDITDHRAEYRRSEELVQRLAAIVESSQDAIIGKDLHGTVMSWNQGAQQLFGYTAEEMIGRPILKLIPPDRHDEERSILERLRRGERIEHYDTVRMRKDGSSVAVSLAVSPIRLPDGTVIGASKVARDISERKRAQEQQALLIREMAHRVKNLFALVGGMIALTARGASTPADLAQSLQARLTALARAHDLTLADPGMAMNWLERSTTLHALLQAIVSPHVAQGEGDRVTFDGPEITIAGNAITSFALLMHELATNAAKYGAWSTAEGRVHVQWAREDGELRLSWTESGGPAIEQPVRQEGFGSLLARQTAVSLQGSIAREWRSDGVVVRLTARLARLA